MNIYIAAKFEMRPVLRALVPQIRSLGHAITATWISREEMHLPQSMIAIDDLDGIEEADLLILDSTFSGGSGREVELGYALAKGKRIWMIGPAVNVFHHHQDIIHFNDWQQVMKQLQEESNAG